jgi:hypothetical protein
MPVPERYAIRGKSLLFRASSIDASMTDSNRCGHTGATNLRIQKLRHRPGLFAWDFVHAEELSFKESVSATVRTSRRVEREVIVMIMPT